MPCCQVAPPSVEVFQLMSEAPPSGNRSTCEELTTVSPQAKVSGWSSVACWPLVLVNGSVLTRIGLSGAAPFSSGVAEVTEGTKVTANATIAAQTRRTGLSTLRLPH